MPKPVVYLYIPQCVVGYSILDMIPLNNRRSASKKNIVDDADEAKDLVLKVKHYS